MHTLGMGCSLGLCCLIGSGKRHIEPAGSFAALCSLLPAVTLTGSSAASEPSCASACQTLEHGVPLQSSTSE